MQHGPARAAETRSPSRTPGARCLRCRFCVIPACACERAPHVDRRVAPQLAEHVVPHHRAARSQSTRGRSARRGRGRPRRGSPCRRAARRAGRTARRGAGGSAAAGRPARARACARGRSSARSSVTNTAGCSATRVGDALAAPQARADQVVGVLAVALGARRADGLAAVAARLTQDPVGLGARAPHPPAAVAVTRLDVPHEAHGPRAVPRRAQLRLELGEVRARRRAGRARRAARASACSCRHSGRPWVARGRGTPTRDAVARRPATPAWVRGRRGLRAMTLRTHGAISIARRGSWWRRVRSNGGHAGSCSSHTGPNTCQPLRAQRGVQ